MNDFKKALIDVAGDLSESERNVKRALQGKKKYQLKRNVFVVPIFVMALCLIGFTLWLLPNKIEQQQASNNNFLNDYLFDYYKMAGLMMSNVDSNEEEQQQWIIDDAFNNYQTAIAIQQYAKSLELTYTAEQYEEREQQLNALYSNAENPFYEQLTKQFGMTLQQYETYVKPVLIENMLYLTQFNDKALAENPKLHEFFVDVYTKKLANDYLEANFEQELTIAKERYKVTVQESINYGSVPKSGTIAAIEGKMIYFIQNTTYEEIQQMTLNQLNALQEDRLKAWLVNYDEIDVHVGDFVRVSVNGTSTSYNERITNGLAENLEVYIPAEKFVIPEIQLPEAHIEDWHQLTNELSWQSQHAVSNYLTPRYIVTIKGGSYTIFENDYNNFFLVPFGEPTIAKLPQGQTKKMENFLMQFVTK